MLLYLPKNERPACAPQTNSPQFAIQCDRMTQVSASAMSRRRSALRSSRHTGKRYTRRAIFTRMYADIAKHQIPNDYRPRLLLQTQRNGLSSTRAQLAQFGLHPVGIVSRNDRRCHATGHVQGCLGTPFAAVCTAPDWRSVDRRG